MTKFWKDPETGIRPAWIAYLIAGAVFLIVAGLFFLITFGEYGFGL